MDGLYVTVLKRKFEYRKYQIIGLDAPEVTVISEVLELIPTVFINIFSSHQPAEEQWTHVIL